MNVDVDIANILKEYTGEVEEDLEKSEKKIKSEAVKKLKATSPKKMGKYAKGWKAKKTKNGFTVHNADHYQLTHLLEFGHAKRGGGFVPAKPHIKKVEQEAINDFETEVRRRLNK